METDPRRRGICPVGRAMTFRVTLCETAAGQLRNCTPRGTRRRRAKGNTGYLFSTKDAKKEEARLRKNGVKITRPVTKEEWGTIFWFADPDGNEFQVSED